MSLDVPALIDVFGQDGALGACQRLHDVGCRNVQFENGCVCVRGVNGGDFTECGHATWVVFLQNLHDCELHIGCRKWLTVVEGDVFAQLECDRFSVSRFGPTFSKTWARFQVKTVLQQAIKNFGSDLADGASC